MNLEEIKPCCCCAITVFVNDTNNNENTTITKTKIDIVFCIKGFNDETEYKVLLSQQRTI